MFSEFGEVSSVKSLPNKICLAKTKDLLLLRCLTMMKLVKQFQIWIKKSIKERQISVSEARPPQERKTSIPGPGGGSGGNSVW